MLDIENSNLQQIIQGYMFENDIYTCMYCREKFEIGELFNFGKRYFDAHKAIRVHIETIHSDKLSELITRGNKYLALTDNQKELFALFYSGLSDNEIAKKLGVASSTVRHQKFIFRERAKAAKLFLAAWSIVEENKNKHVEFLPVHRGATMVDERYDITVDEYKKILGNVFESLEPLKLKVMSPKEKKKIVILRKISEQFDEQKKYTE